METMFAIGRRNSGESDGFAMWHGPSPSEREMLNVSGTCFKDFIIRFDGDMGSKEGPTHRLAWIWNDIQGQWKRYAPKVLNRNQDQYLINQLGEDCVYIGRGSKWGNPFRIGRDGTRDEVIIKYAERLLNDRSLLGSIEELTGKFLVCYCSPEACHGDVLIELANPIIEEATDSWEFRKYLPDPEDIDIKCRECQRYLELIRKSDCGENDFDIFHAGFTRGLAWGIHKTTRHFDHLTRAQADRYLHGAHIYENGEEDDIPF